jgi:hypothetical protein
MFLKKWSVLVMLVSCTAMAQPVELRLKFEPGQEKTTIVEINLKGTLDVQGSARLVGSAEGTGSLTMKTKTLEVSPEGIATLENRMEGFKLDLKSTADMGQGETKYEMVLDENGGKIILDGEEQPIPASELQEARAEVWTTKMNQLGATVGMDLDSSELSAEEAAEVQQLTESISGMLGSNAPLPEKPVQVGDSWTEELKIADLTQELAKDNPMLSTLTNLGIPDVVTNSSLTELRSEEGNQVGTVSSTTKFDWTEGNIPLGFFNIQVNKLAFNAERLTEVNVTEGYLPRITGVTTIEYDIAINLPFGEEGPQTFNATGSIRGDSTLVTE